MSPIEVGAFEAKNRLSEYLSPAEKGQTIFITRRGKRVTMLTAAADEILGLALQGKAQLCAPDLWTYELLNLLIMAESRGRIDPPQIPGALHLIQQVPITLYDHSTLLSRSRTATFAGRFSLSAYEASYIELADRLQAPLRTLDQPLSQAAESLGLG